jgi:hypothetical protein
MRTLGIKGYKRKPVDCINAVVAYLKEKRITLLIDNKIRKVCETYITGRGTSTDYDAADALVCATVGILYNENLARPMKTDSNADCDVEGVIWSI